MTPEDVQVLARTIAAGFFTHDQRRQDNLSTQISAALTAYGDARAAQERERAIQAVTAQANALQADVDDAFYAGYKLAIRNALAAIRADQPGA